MKWEYLKGRTQKQIDIVGNIIQPSGAVQPLACQKCKTKFSSHKETRPIIEKVPTFQCDDCEFASPSGESAFEHKLEFEDHKIIKTLKDRIVKVNTVAVGNLAHIKKTKDDVLILCGDCIID